jgi:hypothetical protein
MKTFLNSPNSSERGVPPRRDTPLREEGLDTIIQERRGGGMMIDAMKDIGIKEKIAT